jgi:fructose-1,6-bisphosphatase
MESRNNGEEMEHQDNKEHLARKQRKQQRMKYFLPSEPKKLSEEQKENLTTLVTNFVNSEQTTLHLSPKLSKEERAFIHDLAEKNRLSHYSMV